MGKPSWKKLEEENWKWRRRGIYAFVVLVFLVFLLYLTFCFPNRKVNFFSEIIFDLLLVISLLVGIFLLAKPNKIEKTKIRNKIFRYFFIFDMIIVLIFMIIFSEEMVEDIPYVIESNYVVTEGKINYISYGRRGTKSFEVNNIEFVTALGDKNFSKEGGKYRIIYLPNSKFIMELSRYK